MYKFLELLEESASTKRIASLYGSGLPMDKTQRPRKFEAIKVGDYYLSIQASHYHFCNPELTLDDLSQYKSMELAIIKNEQFVDPEKEADFKGFSRYEELCERFTRAYGEPVGLNVSVDLIQDLYDYLNVR